jgi:hypothetical protein
LHKEFPGELVRDAVADRLAAGRLTADEVRQVLLNQTMANSCSGSVVVPDMVAGLQVPVGEPTLYNQLLEVGV